MNGGDTEANTLITEFDQEVTKRCNMIKTSAENTSDNMFNALGLILGSIPECVRKMPLKALVQNFNGDIYAATSYFTPKNQNNSPHSSKKAGKRNLPLSQTLSLSDLLKQQAASAAGLPPPAPRTPTKSPALGTSRTPTRQRGATTKLSKVASQPKMKSSPKTTTRSGMKFF